MIWQSKTYRIEQEQSIPQPRTEVFSFFSDAFNLQKLTPSFLNFKIIDPKPVSVKEGTLIDYRIRLFGIPMKWCTRIERFEIDEVFVDTQIRGPYRLWHHTHTFEDQGDGTIMRDIVVYRLPFGILGTIVHALFVRRTLESIFQYRYDALAQLMGGQA
jgi:ligand-binding SRPBCC domain-containing protein